MTGGEEQFSLIRPQQITWCLCDSDELMRFHLLQALHVILFFLPSRPLEYPDCVESADSDVADITELEKLDKAEAGLEKRPGAWPLHLSSDQEQVDSGLALLLAVEQEVLPLTITEAKSRKEVLF